MVTGMRILASPFLYACLLYNYWDIAFLFCFLGGITDFLDGYIARKRKETSLFGERFDPIADKIMMTAIYLGLWKTNLIPFSLLFVVLGRDILLILGATFVIAQKRNIPLFPLMLSKINTCIQLFLCAWIVSMMALQSKSEIAFNAMSSLTPFFIYLTATTTILSGCQYIKRFFEFLFKSKNN